MTTTHEPHALTLDDTNTPGIYAGHCQCGYCLPCQGTMSEILNTFEMHLALTSLV